MGFSDPDELVIGFLERLVGVPVGTEVPNPRPDKFIRVMRTGNSRLSAAHRMIQETVECWDASGEAAAARFADQVEALLSDWEEIPASEDGWVSGSVPERDEDTGVSRYVLTVVFPQFWE